jgi:hypothetical protein
METRTSGTATVIRERWLDKVTVSAPYGELDNPGQTFRVMNLLPFDSESTISRAYKVMESLGRMLLDAGIQNAGIKYVMLNSIETAVEFDLLCAKGEVTRTGELLRVIARLWLLKNAEHSFFNLGVGTSA